MNPSRDLGLRERYARDVSVLRGLPDAVLRPRDAKDVQDAVAEAAATATAVLAVGGQTSTTGASVPVDGGLVVDMTTIDSGVLPSELDVVRGVIDVAPGVTLAALQALVGGHGWELPVDPTSAQTCTIGGAVATNASGPSTFLHGSMARWVAGATFIDGLGRRHSVTRPRVTKRAMGPAALQDPTQWLVGSEGTLGLITRLSIRLRPKPDTIVGALVALDSVAVLTRAVAMLQAERLRAPRVAHGRTTAGGDAHLRAVEWLDSSCCQLIAPHAKGLRVPSGQGGGLFLLVEGTVDAALSALERTLHRCGLIGAAAADAQLLLEPAQLRNFERLRHHVPDTLNRRGRALEAAAGGGKLSTDWSVPIAALDALIAEDHRVFAGMEGVELFRYGHIGDGHPHLNVLCADAQRRTAAMARLEQQLTRVVAAGGVPVSEHGIGKLKRAMVAKHLPAGTRAAWLGLKAWLDPAAVLAPGNLFDR